MCSSSPNPTEIVLDLREKTCVLRRDAIARRHQRVDVLINNAGAQLFVPGNQ
jgi:NADP-dependent 3-hydroxy acid dehydrogenase YdfG